MTKRSTPKRDFGAVGQLWSSPWTRWVGLRYLKSKKNSRFLSFITLLSTVGVGLGVTAMIVVLSIMDGFESELKKRMVSSDLHILVQPTSQVAGFSEGIVPSTSISSEQVQRLRELTQGQLVHFWPMITTEAILKTGRKVTGVSLKGVGLGRLKQLESQLVEKAQDSLLESEAFLTQGDLAAQANEAQINEAQAPHEGQPIDPALEGVRRAHVKLPELYLGRELSYELGVIPSDEVTLISPLETDGPVEGIPRLKKAMVKAVYSSGHPDQELHTAYAPDTFVRSFLKRRGGVSQWEITVKDFNEAPWVAEVIRAQLPNFRVQDWKQMNAHLFASLRLERISMFVILAFIVVVASFNIVTTLTLMVLEKKKEISILKTMGARDSQVAAIFLSEGLLIGTIGIVSGTLLGYGLCLALRTYPLIELPEIYYDRTLPVTFELGYYVGISVVALLIVLCACLYPSARAARLNPLDGIRFG